MKKRDLIFLLVVAMLAILPATTAAAPPLQGEEGQEYTIQADDWLSKLADKFLGDPLAYPAITYYTNQKNAQDESFAKITDPNAIEVGMKVYIPTQAEAEAYVAERAQSLGEGTVKIGAVIPLSAPGSVTGGEAMKAAFEIALEEINAAGGVLGQQVELVVLDTEGLPERGSAAMERLINQEGVVAVVGEYHSAVALTEKEVAKANNIPIVFAETWSDSITEAQDPQVFRIAPMSSLTAEVYTKYLSSVVGANKVVIMTENTSYGTQQAETLADQLAAEGIETVTFSADIGTQDFSGIIERIKAENPDAIFVSVTGETSYNFEQQAAEAGIGPQDVPMICNQVAGDSEAFWANVPDGNLCVYTRVGLPRALYTPETTAFVEKYTAKTGKTEAESYAMEAYDSLKLVAQAINEAGSTDGDAIINALENISYDGALGTITFPYGTQNPIPEGVAAKWWHQFPDPAITLVQYQEQGQQSADAPVVFPESYLMADPILPGQ